MSDKDRGIYRKYHVERLNDPDGKHDECGYFVLDPRHDPIARHALNAYWQEARRQGYEQLAVELRDWVAVEAQAAAGAYKPGSDMLPGGLTKDALPPLPYERDMR